MALLRRPAELDQASWLQRWQHDHTPVAIETQSTFGYTQNAVVRALTPNALPLAGIVEELFPAEAITDLKAFFGAGLSDHSVIATKSAHGHLMGGSGAMELIFGVLAIQRGAAPPVLNYLGPDPNCDIPLIVGETQAITQRHLVSNAFAFGGLNSVLIARAV